MTRSRAPVWLIAPAAAFLGYYALIVYCDIFRPENPGMEYQRGTLVIDKIAAGSPADRAGLQVGDDVVTVDGHPIANRFDIEARDLHLEFDRPRDFMVVRPTGVTHLSVVIGPARSGYLFSQEELVLLGLRAMLLVTLGLGLLISWRRPRDPAALLAAGLLASAGVFSVALPYRAAAIWRDLPAPVALPMWLPFFSAAGIGAWAFAFFSMFPERRRWSGGIWIIVIAPMAIALAFYGAESVRIVYRPDDLEAVAAWRYRLLLFTNVAYILAALATLVVRYRRLADAGARRRLRVLMVGSLVGWLAGMPVVLNYWRGDVDLTHSMFGSRAMAVGGLFLLVVPMSFAYAVLRHRLFDVSVIVRMGVRYALAKRALVSLVPALAIVLVADVLLHGNDRLLEILQRRGVIYIVIAVAAIVAHTQRGRWLDALDRRFFRERYDARRLLGRLVADVRQVGSFELMAPRAVSEIEAALHSRFVAISVRQPTDASFRVAAIAPSNASLDPLPDAMTLIKLMRVLNKPLEVGGDGDDALTSQLPDGDRQLLDEQRIDFIVPIALGEDRAEAMLILGAKRSEEPYSQEDRDLLSAGAEGLALLLERARLADTAENRLAECPSCGLCYDSRSETCAHEGARLTSIALPRTLAGRYRLQRRLGRGGMGTVYAATDTALDRLVAAKVIRADLVSSVDASARFQQEARVAARFAHPNVVVVHDFGVTSGNIGYLVMELLDGRTLRAELNERDRLDPRRALAILRDVASAVDAAHRQGLIHRDLKPENIFLVPHESEEVAKVLDFGLAKPVSSSVESPTVRETSPGVLLGTPAYMAPEQLRGEDAHPSWDVWALAVVSFEMLSGRHPFAGVSAASAVPGVSGYESLLADRLESAPAEYARFFTRALAIDPAARPASARTLLDEFERAIQAERAASIRE